MISFRYSGAFPSFLRGCSQCGRISQSRRITSSPLVRNADVDLSPRVVPSSSAFRVCANPFSAIPEVWLTSLDSVEPRHLEILRLHPDVFRAPPRLDILHRNITWQSVYRNLQLTKMLSKAEMPGGGAKPWPQKKQGRAHVGSIRSPQFVHGGFAHGARGPRTWFYMLPDAIRLKGLCVALTVKHAQNDLVVVDSLDRLPSDDPQFLHEIADHRNWGYSVLFVDTKDEIHSNLAIATESTPTFTVMPVYGLNCYSIMKYDTLVLSLHALEMLQSRILAQLHRAESLQKKFRYKDMKQKLLNEGERDPVIPPFV